MESPERVLIFLGGMLILMSTIQFFVGYFLGYTRAKKEINKTSLSSAELQPLCKYAKINKKGCTKQP